MRLRINYQLNYILRERLRNCVSCDLVINISLNTIVRVFLDMQCLFAFILDSSACVTSR